MANPKLPELPGIPPKTTKIFRVNYQFAAPSGDLRAGSLIIEAENIQKARDTAVIKLEGKFGDKWHKTTLIKTLDDEAPF